MVSADLPMLDDETLAVHLVTVQARNEAWYIVGIVKVDEGVA